MNKQDITSIIAEELGIKQGTAVKMLNKLIEIIHEGLNSEERITLSGLGTFYVRQLPSRRIRNPNTGEIIVTKATRKIIFKASDKIKKTLNEVD